MRTPEPRIIVIAGPNGAGKSTLASRLFPSDIVFINADEIAKQLPVDTNTNRDREAGRILLRRMDELTTARQSLAVETTLSSKSLVPRIRSLRESGYVFQLFFIFSPDPDFSVSRVAARVRLGGHNIPEAIIRRRYERGIHNFFGLYLPLADQWRVYQNVNIGHPQLIASGGFDKRTRVKDMVTWQQFKGKASL